MNILKKVLFVLFTFFISFSFFACAGYKPSTHYAKEEISGKVFVKVSIDLEDPKNSVLIKDSITQLLIQKLDVELVNKESLADTVMNVGVNSVSMQTLQYDKAGYNKLYRAVVQIDISYFKKSENKRKSFSVDGEYDFSVDNAGTINDTQRYNAIQKASEKAIEEVLSKIAVQSFKK
ncbi:MAG: hypothetical protein KBE77_03055 [Aliarcobacter sp.]|nr:hypothetical protein [Aliarcobacter sp.]